MNRLSRKFLVCTAFLTISSAANMAYARGEGSVAGAVAGAGGLRPAVTSAAARTQVAAADSANPQIGQPTASPVASAQTEANPCATPMLMDGSYIGAMVGYGSFRLRNRISNPIGLGYELSPVTAMSNWSLGAVIGYGKMLTSRLYLGAEIFAAGNTAEQDFILDDGTFIYTNQNASGPTYGIGLLPGFRFTNETLAYIRLGWNRTTVQSTESVNGFQLSNVSNPLNAFVFGVGLETLITGNYSLRGEFSHMFINSYNTYGFANTTVYPSSNQYMLSVIYHA